MITKIYNGKVITDRKIENKDVYFKDGKIIAVTTESLPFDKEIDAKGQFVSPGFVEIHTHGAADWDFLDNSEEGYFAIARAHAEHGATTILPTITSSTKERTLGSLKVYEKIKNVKHDGANMPGLHLEGPYFSPKQSGEKANRHKHSDIAKQHKKDPGSPIKTPKNLLEWCHQVAVVGFSYNFLPAGVKRCQIQAIHSGFWVC